ncbi:MFS transporter [Chloroflexota bacterium]
MVPALLVPLLPLIRNEFTLDYAQAGWLVTAYTISYGISQIPGGWLVDRIGPRIMIAISISVAALFGLIVGFTTTYTMLIIILILLGAAGGGYHPASTPLLSSSTKPESRGRILGFHQIGGTASQLAAPMIAVAIAAAWGWRGSFIGTAVPTIILGIVVYLLIGKWRLVQNAERGAAENYTQPSSVPGELRRLLIFSALSITGYALIFGTISFIPLYLVDHFGVSEEIAAGLLVLTYSGGIWAGPLGGYLSDRFGRIPIVVIVGFIAGPAIYLLNLASYGLAISITLVVIGMSMFMQMPISEAYIVTHAPEHRRSMILGTFYFCRNGGGGIAAAILGYFIDNAGFSTGFTIVTITLITVTLVCSIFLWRSRG